MITINRADFQKQLQGQDDLDQFFSNIKLPDGSTVSYKRFPDGTYKKLGGSGTPIEQAQKALNLQQDLDPTSKITNEVNARNTAENANIEKTTLAKAEAEAKAAKLFPKPLEVGEEQKKKLIAIESSKKLLDQIDTLLKSKNFDTGRSQISKQYLRKLLGPTVSGLKQSDEEQQFDTTNTALLNTYIQALSGAQTSPQEAERLGKEVPGLILTRQEIKNRIKVMRKKLEDQKNAIGEVVKQTPSQLSSDKPPLSSFEK